MAKLSDKLNKVNREIAKELEYVTGWGERRMALVQSRLHKIINAQFAEELEAEKAAALDGKADA